MVNPRRHTMLVFGALALFAAPPAHATEPPAPLASASPNEPSAAPAESDGADRKVPESKGKPAVHHAPILTATMAEDLVIEATLDRPHQLRRAVVVFRGGGTHGEVTLARSSASADAYVAVIPATAVRGRLAYAIELETTDGEIVPAFATRAAPYEVTVLDDVRDRREAALLERLGGRRSVVETSTEYASFGGARVTLPAQPGAPARTIDVKDQFYRFEGSYTYRLLGIVSELGIRAGAVRGVSAIRGESDPSKYEVGLNYGAPRIRLSAGSWVHLDVELLTSVTEVGFAVGGGGALLLGDPYGSKIVFGGEGIEVFGARGYTRLDVVAHKRVLVSPMVEVTGMPHADTVGVRLLGEGRFDLGRGFGMSLRGGYQARTFDRGGPTLGAGVAYAF